MQGTITVDTNQWSVAFATTATEIATGLSGVTSMPAGTGVLFDLGSDRSSINIDMSRMLFNLDIIFINSIGGVVGKCSSVAPGEACAFDAGAGLGARYFLEVNAGEADGVEIGGNVNIEGEVQPAFWAGLIAAVYALSTVAIVGTSAYRLVKEELAEAKEVGKPPKEIEHHSNPGRRYGEPKTEAERRGTHEEFYGTRELPPRGTGLEERGESAEGRGLGEPKTTAERRETHGRKYGTRGLPPRGTGLEGHSIHGPERQKLVDQHGTWAVGRAESVCPEDDVECVAREASRLLGAYRRGYNY